MPAQQKAPAVHIFTFRIGAAAMSDASLTPETIAKLKRLEAEAIKSKLRRHELSVNTVDFDEGTITVHMNCHPDDVMDKCYTDELKALSDLIVAARNALPALLAALAAKDAEIERLRSAVIEYLCRVDSPDLQQRIDARAKLDEAMK